MAKKNEIKQAVQNFFNDEAEAEVKAEVAQAEKPKLEIKQPIAPAPEGYKVITTPDHILLKSSNDIFLIDKAGSATTKYPFSKLTS